MNSELMVAAFLMAVGLSTAGAGTHLYQGIANQPAMLRFDGRTVFGMFGHLLMSFVCGPYIMLRMGLRDEGGGTVSLTSVLMGSAVAFGWAFITGILLVTIYIALLHG